jgi:hypothetical protein
MHWIVAFVLFRGSYAIVVRGREKKTGKDVAIKIIKKYAAFYLDKK